jgi:hypothetical protein
VRIDFADFIVPKKDSKVKNETLTDKQISGILTHASSAIAFLKAVQIEAMRLKMKSASSLPDWKVVEGKSRRKWKNEEEAISRLRKLGLALDEIAPPRLLGITDISRLFPAGEREKALAQLVIKPHGKPTLAPASDPRPSIRSDAAFDFADDLEEEDT